MNYQNIEEWCISFNRKTKEAILEYWEEKKKQKELDSWHICVQKENINVEY